MNYIFRLVAGYRRSGGPISNSGIQKSLYNHIAKGTLCLNFGPMDNDHIPTPTPSQKVHGFTRFMKVTFKISEGSLPPDPPVTYVPGYFEICIRYHDRLIRASDIWYEQFQYLDSLLRSVTFIIILFMMSRDNSCASWLVGAANWTQQISIKTN